MNGEYQLAPATVTSRMFLQEFSAFAELINDNNYDFYAPKERFSSRRLIATYEKYQKWYRNLPAPLQLPEHGRPLPHFIILQYVFLSRLTPVPH